MADVDTLGELLDLQQIEGKLVACVRDLCVFVAVTLLFNSSNNTN